MADADQKALNALAKGAGITVIGALFSKAITYIYRVTIARFIGPEAYGQLSLAIMVVGIGSTLALLSLNQGIQKYIPEFRTKNDMSSIKGILLSSLHISLPTSILVTLAIFFGSEFIAVGIFNNRELVPLLQIMAAAPLFKGLSEIFLDTTIGFNKAAYKIGVKKIAQNVVQLGVTLVLVFLGWNVEAAAWGWLAGSFFAAILGFYFMEKKVGPILRSDEKPTYNHRKLLKFSSPLLLSGIITTIMGWADTAFLGYFMTDYEVGLYNAALPTAMLIMIPHSAIGSLAVSSFSELKERSEESLESSIRSSSHWTFSMIFPGFLLMAFFSEEILQILFGPQYSSAALALAILAAGNLASASAGQVGDFLKSKGHSRTIFYNTSIALVLNIGLNFFLIPLFGMIGAAIATASSTIATNALLVFESWRKENVITFSDHLGSVTLISIVALLTLVTVDGFLFANTPFWFIIPGILIYGLTYGVLFLKIIGLGEEEINVLERLGDKLGKEEETEKIIKLLNSV